MGEREWGRWGETVTGSSSMGQQKVGKGCITVMTKITELNQLIFQDHLL